MGVKGNSFHVSFKVNMAIKDDICNSSSLAPSVVQCVLYQQLIVHLLIDQLLAC